MKTTKYQWMELSLRNMKATPFTLRKDYCATIAKRLSTTKYEGADFVVAFAALYLLFLYDICDVFVILFFSLACMPVAALMCVGAILSEPRDVVRLSILATRLRYASLLKKYLRYAELIGDMESVEVAYLAEQMSRSRRVVVRDLRGMERARFLKKGTLDSKSGMLYLTERAKEADARDRALSEIKEAYDADRTNTNYKTALHFTKRLRIYNDLLPEKEISDALDETERLLNRILKDAKQSRTYDNRLRRVASCYLPQIETLLYTYRDLYENKQDMQRAKDVCANIVSGVQTFNDALRKMQDDILADASMKVDTELSVMKTLLKQDGYLTDGAPWATRFSQTQSACRSRPETESAPA